MSCKLKEYRKKRGMTQEELADKAGVSRMTIVSLENGTAKSTTSKTMLAIATALGYTVDTIFFGKGV